MSCTFDMQYKSKCFHRFYTVATATQIAAGITAEDIIYNVLPLYHITGGAAAIGQGYITGSTIVLRRKFSANQFWNDCIRYNCTVSLNTHLLCLVLRVYARSLHKQYF